MDNLVSLIESSGSKAVLIYLAFLGVMSLVTFLTYGIDKLKAIKNQWRISEKALLLLSLFGGAVGGLLAMKFLRHKTKHWYFWAVNVVCVAIHIAGLVWIITLV